METWIIYGLIGAIFIWVWNFYSKFITEKKINRNRVFIYSMFSFTFISFLFLLFSSWYMYLTLLIAISAAIRVITGIEKHLFSMESLKYIESSLYFPIHQITHIFLVLIIWIIAFQEYLWLYQIAAMLLWIVIVLLLTDKESRKIQIDYKKWLFFLIISNIFLLTSSTINKYVAHVWVDIPSYMFASGLAWTLYLSLSKKDAFETVDKSKKITEMKLWFSRWFFFSIWYLCVLHALTNWPFVLVQILLILSILIPILLSIIVFKEPVNEKKIWAFLLFIVMIFLMNI